MRLRPEAIQALIFDCDGTLVDSEIPGMDVLHAQACALGLEVTRAQAHRQFRGKRMADCVAWVVAQLPPQPDDFARTFTEQVRRAQAQRFSDGLGVIPGAFELLRALDLPFALATNGPREKVELTLGLTGLRSFFPQHVFTAYEVGSFKPDPGLFLHAAAALGVAPQHCAVVEDSLPGLQAGLAAGMQVFSLMPQADLDAALAQRVTSIADLHALAALLPRKAES